MNGKRARSIRRIVEAGTVGMSLAETKRIYRQTKKRFTRSTAQRANRPSHGKGF